jgi:two-component system cell cycle sensor histidine kinase/response regulator CckA
VLDCFAPGRAPQASPNRPLRLALDAARSWPVALRRLTSWLDRLGVSIRPPAERGDDNRDPNALDRQAEAERRRVQALALAGRVATGLVHDFNNALLVAVACLSQIADTPEQASVVKDQAQTASDALHRAAGVARRLMTIGRPDDGSRERVDLSDLVRASSTLVAPLTRPLIELSVCCPAHALPVRVNAAQIEQAILNLCLNARDAMPDGGTLHVTTRSAIRWIARDESSRRRVPVTYAVVEVSDTGRGIPHALQARVFEPFFTTKGPDRGTGLGLATVRETALAHGGLVELTSDAMGTAVRVLLPLC